jgi:hypothetical protein
MGMFDYLLYEGHQYQTKNTPSQLCDNYKIAYDQDSGHQYLWHENYDAEWVEDDGLFGGTIRQFNHRWEHCADFTGILYFYREDRANGGWKNDKWVEYKATIINGNCVNIESI